MAPVLRPISAHCASDSQRLRIRRLREALPERVEIYYAVKANPSLAVVRLFASLGFGTDVASRGELLAALAAGVPAARILMAGPAKSDADLEAAVAAEVAAIHVEGTHEVERLAVRAMPRRSWPTPEASSTSRSRPTARPACPCG